MGALDLLRLGAESYVAALSDEEFDRLVAITRPHSVPELAEAVNV